jgi:hypothetical protein
VVVELASCSVEVWYASCRVDIRVVVSVTDRVEVEVEFGSVTVVVELASWAVE